MKKIFVYIITGTLLSLSVGTSRAMDAPAPKLVRLFDAGKRVGPSTGINACKRCAGAASFLKAEVLKKTGFGL